MEELLNIFSESNMPLNTCKPKSEIHQLGLWHRSVHILICNSKKEAVLQLRSKAKDLFPDMWDISVAGHVDAEEKPVDSAIREIKEEIGLSISKTNLIFFGIRKSNLLYDKMKDNEFQYIYFLKYDGDISNSRLQKEEVQSIKLMPIIEFENKMNVNPYEFTPRVYWKEILISLKNRT